MLFFVGRKAKDTALHELFPWNNVKKSPRDGVASLRVDNLSLQASFPLFFAESDPQRGCVTDEDTSVSCHETSAFPCHWQLTANQNLFDVIHARIFCLFADVLCLFVDDFHDLEDVVARLGAWAALGRASAQLPMARPRVVLVKKGAEPGPSQTYDLLESEYLRNHPSRPDLAAAFSSITVLDLADEQISPLSRYRPLKELIHRHADEARHLKQSLGCLYSALHLSCFFEAVVTHTARTITEPFDFIRASRQKNPLDPDFTDHLRGFFNLKSLLSLREKAALAASAILLDAYPPAMHGERQHPSSRDGY